MADHPINDQFELEVARELRAYSASGVGTFDAAAVAERARTGAAAGRAFWIPRFVPRPLGRLGMFRLAILAGLLALATLAALVGSQQLNRDPRAVPGLLAVGGVGRIFVIDPASGTIVREIDSGEHDTYPVWSPDGTRIAYSIGGGRDPIHVVNGDGTNDLVIGPGLGADPDAPPAWSPDGTRVAFSGYAYPGGAEQGLYVASLDGQPPRLVLPGSSFSSLAWSRDGSMIAYSAAIPGSVNATVQILDLASGGLTSIGEIAWRGTVSWSDEGTAFAYARERTYMVFSNPDGSKTSGIVLARRVAGTWREQMMIEDPRPIEWQAPFFLPSGRIFFMNGDQPWTAAGDGTDAGPLSAARFGAFIAPECLAPDGSAVVLGQDPIEVPFTNDLLVVTLKTGATLRIPERGPEVRYGGTCSWQALAP